MVKALSTTRTGNHFNLFSLLCFLFFGNVLKEFLIFILIHSIDFVVGLIRISRHSVLRRPLRPERYSLFIVCCVYCNCTDNDSLVQYLKEKGYVFDIAYTSVLKRAIKTLNGVLDVLDLHWIPVERQGSCSFRLLLCISIIK